MAWTRTVFGALTAVVLGGVTYGILVELPPLLQQLHEQDKMGQEPHLQSPITDQLDCNSGAPKRLALKVVHETPPAALIEKAGGKNFSSAENPGFLEEVKACEDAGANPKEKLQACYDAADGATPQWPNVAHLCLGNAEQERDCHAKMEACEGTYNSTAANEASCRSSADAHFSQIVEQAKSKAVYTIKNIRLESRDPTTDAVVCNVTLRVDLPNNLGAAEEEISYKLENLEDGGLHIEVAGLN